MAGVSLRIPLGKTVALVGESGCGKSTTAFAILRLLPQPPASIFGRVLFADPQSRDTVDLLTLPRAALSDVRGNRIALIGQEPMSALNPVFRVGDQIGEVLQRHQGLGRRAAWDRAVELLRKVGIPHAAERARDYPHRMSGGMLQRVVLAMAIACNPCLLIADEPTTALDVTIQRQILDDLHEIQRASGMGILLITHDLGIVAEFAHEVYVMYAGAVVEQATAAELLDHPLHPYTQGLLACTPRISQAAGRLKTIPGMVPDSSESSSGCRFHPRCSVTHDRSGQPGRIATQSLGEFGGRVLRRCVEPFEAEPSGVPLLRELRPGHWVACWEAH